MTRVAVPQMRSLVEETPGGLSISMPAPRHPFALLFLPVWLVGWGFGELSAIRSLLAGTTNEPRLFLLVWLAFWTLGGGWAALTLLRMLVGKERLDLDGDVLRHRHELLGLGRSKEYELRHVHGLRAAAAAGLPAAWRGLAPGQGTIAFDYGAKTIRVGDGLEEAEAAQIISRLQQRHRFAPTASAV